jgi:hypothetical protein
VVSWGLTFFCLGVGLILVVVGVVVALPPPPVAPGAAREVCRRVWPRLCSPAFFAEQNPPQHYVLEVINGVGVWKMEKSRVGGVGRS